ncbi:MAG: hypothetical protein OSB38_36515 [Paraburkholderia fungorum]|nr:hypothetical protein [Paraburkholderia fungorum]
MKTNLVRTLLISAVLAAVPPAFTDDAEAPAPKHDHHAGLDAHQEARAPAVQAKVPPLRILFPKSGDRVGTSLAVVFETPGDMSRMTMSAAAPDTHLHLEVDGVILMPTESQLIRLGGKRYLFVFDLPVEPGERTIRVYWSDAEHRTIESSVQSVKVMAEGVKQSQVP